MGYWQDAWPEEVIVAARRATASDVGTLVQLYGPARDEQADLREAWPVADGLAEPVDAAFASILDDDESALFVGGIDDVVLGFIWARLEDLRPQAAGERIGVIKLVYVEEWARMVAVGEAMLDQALDWLRGLGITKFDAIVSPGHRLAKNFFESAGFKARRITMYHDDNE
ncbi:MAG: GNAT family N-acetyltransferase [bacterium]|nr:GNAT family N-acetyltransferase [bacterium]